MLSSIGILLYVEMGACRETRAVRDVVRQAKLIQAMQVGILHGKVEPDHPERNPARQEANSGRGVAECVSVPEEPYEGNPHVRFCEGGAGPMTCIPLLDSKS